MASFHHFKAFILSQTRACISSFLMLIYKSKLRLEMLQASPDKRFFQNYISVYVLILWVFFRTLAIISYEFKLI